MKKTILTLIVFTIILLSIKFAVKMLTGDTSLDIQFHDTFFVFTYTSLVIPVLLCLTFIFSLVLSLSTKFKHELFKRLLIISGIGLAGVFFYFISLTMVF